MRAVPGGDTHREHRGGAVRGAEQRIDVQRCRRTQVKRTEDRSGQARRPEERKHPDDHEQVVAGQEHAGEDTHQGHGPNQFPAARAGNLQSDNRFCYRLSSFAREEIK
jgi:hypothetical protein